MRIIIRLNSERPIKVPFNYNNIITGIVYTTLQDKEYSNYLHEHKGFKYFTISQLHFHNYHVNKKEGYFHVREGFTFTVSCPEKFFILTLMEGLSGQKHVYLNNQPLTVESIMVEPEIVKKETMNYRTLSPILVRSKRVIDGVEKVYDLNPSEPDFYRQIEKLVVKKYNQFYGVEKYTLEDIVVTSQMRHVKGVRVALKKRGNVTFNRAYFMDLEVTAPVALQDFLYDCGLGEKTAMGFGCICL